MPESRVLKIRQGKAGGGKGALIGEEVSFTLATSQDQTLFDGTGTGYVVRRLTPVECERLQGFPSCVELKVEQMTSDELMACALANGDVFCNVETGKVYGTRGPGGVKLDEPRELGFRHPSGYIHINLMANGVKKQVRAHRLIWIAANGAIPDGMVIDHINNKKDDNRLSNLQLLTPENNSLKARFDGRYLCGEDNPAAKTTAYIRETIRHEYSGGNVSYRELAVKYGISKSTVCNIVNETGWTDVPYKGKEHPSDTPRYKACGNSMAVPVMRWIGERIQMVDEMEEDE